MRLNSKSAGIAAALLVIVFGGKALAMAQVSEASPPPADGGPAQPGMPDEAAGYDEVGYAGTHGAGMDGGNIASGSPAVASGISAAHATLPLPSYVEVTALDTGKTILVLVNDRSSPTGRLIDLSAGAAQQLGVADGAAVRVRRVNPPDQEKAVLMAQGEAAPRLDAPDALLTALRAKLAKRAVPPVAMPVRAAVAPPARAAPSKAGARAAAPPVATRPPVPPAPPHHGGRFIVEQAGQSAPPAPVRSDTPGASFADTAPPAPPARASGKAYVVQVAAFSSQARAQALARRIGASMVEAGGIWRVRYGPYPTQEAAQAGLRQAASKGFKNGRIMANDAR